MNQPPDTKPSHGDQGHGDQGPSDKPKDRTVTVTVNDHPVILDDRKQTGAEIKAAAIDAGVPIQLDFVLSEVLPNGKQRIVPDDKSINVKEGDAFWAIPGDDNS